MKSRSRNAIGRDIVLKERVQMARLPPQRLFGLLAGGDVLSDPAIRTGLPCSSQIAWPRDRNQRYSPDFVWRRHSMS